MTTLQHRPFVLIIRDGWGANPNPDWNHANAVHLARTPVDDKLMAEFPHTQIATHGREVGLPDGVMGNSEVGHQNIGAGRIVDQEIMRLTRTIEDGSFFDNKVIRNLYENATRTGGSVHLMGLCSDAGVHSTLEHLFAVLEVGRRSRFDSNRVFVHAFTDGRDTAPFSGIDFLGRIESKMSELGIGRIASVVGRYYAMDRDNRWDRVESAYRLLTEGIGTRVRSACDACRRYYENPTEDSRKGDEFIVPTIVSPDESAAPATISDGDSVMFFNFRGDRPRELIKAFRFDTFPYPDDQADAQMRGFQRSRFLDLSFATLTAYERGLPVDVAFPKPEKMPNIFGQYVAQLNLTQFRCAETEKFPHVTFFFNDYREEPFPREDRALIPSPRDVSTYDQKPEMSAPAVTQEVVRRIESGRYDIVVVNFANGDMVGHTGNLAATIKAVQVVDEGVGRVVDATRAAGGALIVTADHGNCEQMIDPATNQPHTAHTTFDVELIVVGDAFRGKPLAEGGRLADIIPTAIDILGIPQPAEMTGRSLLS